MAGSVGTDQDGLRAWERQIGFWEGFRIGCAGWRDRIRTRKVVDTKLTHYQIGLQERAQGFQIEVLQWVCAEDARLDAAIAAQQAVLDEQPSQVAATAPQPDSESMKERAQWARLARASARAEAESKSHLKKQDQARAQLGSLKEQRAGLAEQRDIHFALCQQWFEQRAAKYNRARTGWLGLPKSTEHKIPEFEPVQLTESKPGGVAQIGVNTPEVS